jgi:hypothetical protein
MRAGPRLARAGWRWLRRGTQAFLPVRPAGFQPAEGHQAESLFATQSWKSMFRHAVAKHLNIPSNEMHNLLIPPARSTRNILPSSCRRY